MDSFWDNFWATSIRGELEAGGFILEQISIGQLHNSFDALFTNSNAYSICETLHGTIVNGLAYSVLAIVFLVQTVRIANKIDGNQAVPGVKEMIFLLIFFCIGKYIIDNSMLFCKEIYNVTPAFIDAIDPGQTYTHIDMTFLKDQDILVKDLNGIAGFFSGLLFMLACLALCIISYVVVVARAIQIYLYSIFAPIPLAMLLCEETRQQGTGFIKNYLAVCLAGCIIVTLCLLFPSIISSCLQQQDVGFGLLQSLGVIFVFIFGFIKCGSWSRDIFGG